MSRLTGRCLRALPVFAVVVLAWTAATQLDGSGGATSSTSDEALEVEPLETLLIVTSDRPTVFSHDKRTDGHRLVFAMLPQRGTVDPSSSFTAELRPWGWVGSAGVLALHLAERGPPLLAT